MNKSRKLLKKGAKVHFFLEKLQHLLLYKNNKLFLSIPNYQVQSTILLGQFVVVREVIIDVEFNLCTSTCPPPPCTHPPSSLISIQLELDNFDPLLFRQLKYGFHQRIFRKNEPPFFSRNPYFS